MSEPEAVLRLPGVPRSPGMSSHQSSRAQTTTWLTPPTVIAALGPFDLDPCAAPSPRPWATASRHIELPIDGLQEPWEGRVWLNPPYNAAAWDWLSRLADHRDGGIALVFARTETAGFVRTVWQRAHALLFLHGRLHFHHSDGTRARANAGAPSVLVAYGTWAAERLRACGLDGSYVALRDEPEMPLGGVRTHRPRRRLIQESRFPGPNEGPFSWH